MKELHEVQLNDIILAKKEFVVKSLLYPDLIVRITSLKKTITICTKKNYTWINELCSRLRERLHSIIKKRHTFNIP